ncbi:hypothetical protein ICN46_06115 [Polynucleobacter sp. Latsch14-2]|uniref:hypothetical protein n=1 Tax=Polynucleobacter sp. Latsch14-2 TaxID=2576920 RepID=UPI001C0B1D32|nr:hypothetical protein [Polynucleobacter sp. Latsch14-2]MBU3614468.1 hypothetical protein [Polynucleobacter sp. Latsch14-2]
MTPKEINKTLDKAHQFTNAILQEMHETYLEQEIPYFLHVWLLQAAYGLKQYGFELSDIQQLLTREMEPLKNITFELITELLPQPRSSAHEAFEFRFLFAEYNVDKVIYVEYDEGDKMIRFTFPMATANGRGRIWLKRSELSELSKQDLSDFVAMIARLSAAADMGVLVSPPAHKLITETIGAAEFFESGAVVVGKRGSVK